MRRNAREAAFKLVYQSYFIIDKDKNGENVICEDLDEKDREFATELFSLYVNNLSEIKERAKNALVKYDYDRLYKVDLALIELAITEIFYYKQTPAPIVINEVVEFAKRYSTDKSYGFINGVLSSIVKGQSNG